MSIIIESGFEKKSIESIGLYVKDRPEIPTPSQRIESFDVPGRDGSLTIANGLEDIEITVEFNVLDDDFKNKIRGIKRFLFESKRLYFEDDKDFFFNVKIVRIGDIENEVKYYGSFEVVFLCDPYQYKLSTFDFSNKLTDIRVRGYKATPLLKVTPRRFTESPPMSIYIYLRGYIERAAKQEVGGYMKGNYELAHVSESMTLRFDYRSEPFYIDFDLMQAYDSRGVLVDETTGGFNNFNMTIFNVTYSDGIESVEIKLREGWL